MATPREIAIYLQLAERRAHSHAGNLRIVTATTEPPTRREKRTVVVKIRVRVPAEAFQPAKHPTAVVEVPLAMLSPVTDEDIEAIAESAED